MEMLSPELINKYGCGLKTHYFYFLVGTIVIAKNFDFEILVEISDSALFINLITTILSAKCQHKADVLKQQ